MCTTQDEVDACNEHLRRCNGDPSSQSSEANSFHEGPDEAYDPEKTDRILSVYFYKEKGNNVFGLHDGSLRINATHLPNDIKVHDDFLVGYGHATRKSDFKDLRSLSNAEVHKFINSIRNGTFCRIDVLKNSSNKFLSNPQLPVSPTPLHF